jgi:hypothetical protein
MGGGVAYDSRFVCVRPALFGRSPLGLSAFVWLLLLASVVPPAHAGAGIKSDEQVLFYPALARQRVGGWDLQVDGLVYEPERHRILSEWVRRLLGFDEEELTKAERALFRERIGYFMVDNERDKEIRVRAGPKVFRLGRSQANGHFSGRWRWPTNDATFFAWADGATNGVLRLELPLEQSHGRKEFMDVHLLGERGLSVISDIDDTIKISQVLEQDALLRNTFCRPFQPVPGVAARYRLWQRNNGAQFHYVTASPWQLYAPLSAFVRSNDFPQGTFHMKNSAERHMALSCLARPTLVQNERARTVAGASRRVVRLGRRFGEKRSERSDGELARRIQHNNRIFIRNVTTEDAQAPRYATAFRALPRSLWQIFTEALRATGENSRPEPGAGHAQGVWLPTYTSHHCSGGL